jgi:putative ABC transport system permease protein
MDVRASERVYKLLLAVYPREFRDEYGEEMARTFCDRCRGRAQSSGLAGVAGLWLDVVPDLTMTVWREHMSILWQDIRFGARSLARTPGVTLIAGLSLALAVAANSTMFSLLSAYLLQPLPYADADRLVVLWETDRKDPGARRPAPIANTNDWEAQSTVFEDIALVDRGSSPETFSGAGPAERVTVKNVSENLFSVLGVRPQLGRSPDESTRSAGHVLISDGFWNRRFNRDPTVIGLTFNLESRSRTVIGILPPGFHTLNDLEPDIWRPINVTDQRWSRRNDHWLLALGRLKPGYKIGQAQEEMNAIASRLEQAYPKSNHNVGVFTQPLDEFVRSGFGRYFAPLFGAVAFVLLIACTNVANLLLARLRRRQKELALRASLGAGRVRLARQLLTESLVLSIASAAVGVLLTFAGIRALLALAPFPNAEQITVDWRVLLFTLAISILTGVLFGIAPALEGSRLDLNTCIKAAGPFRAGPSGRLTRGLLVISEVALAVVLLVGAGLMMNSLVRLSRSDPGFDSRNILTAEITLPEGKYVRMAPGSVMKEVSPQATQFWRRLLDALSATPGVGSVAMIGQIPTRWLEPRTFTILGAATAAEESRPTAGYSEMTPSFFQVLGIAVKRGRALSDRDVESAPWAVVVNEAFARKFFPDSDPIGQRLVLRMEPYRVEEDRPREIVGVVGNVKHNGVRNEAPPAMYVSYLQQPPAYPGGRAGGHLRQNLILRPASGAAASLSPALRRVVGELDPDLPVDRVMTMKEALGRSFGDNRLYLQLLGIFAAMALLLAAVGVYGVISHSVTERTREIGVRMALGARHGDVVRMILRQGLLLVVTGVAVGVLGSVAATQLIRGFLYGVTPTDPVTYTAVAAILIGVALVAIYLPALRASRVDPAVTLRQE